VGKCLMNIAGYRIGDVGVKRRSGQVSAALQRQDGYGSVLMGFVGSGMGMGFDRMGFD
jgi:hypothetical protein